jgi:transcriptional regulator with XRE-family HTH domain
LLLALQDRPILQAAREAQGLSLADIYEPAGMDRSALSELEKVTNENPTIDTLLRFTKVVGKRLQIQVADS